ncbi:putative Chemotaxis protein CheY [Candidatus Terasakiella magnetica]|uniref:Putative Chemotaxis protein CheY n=1 Tax=Candidatus Terasakiella magnetica TaxID=1867952 RepID=A0A1C3RI72_9PROT|nr:response regulator [Candidatus Terasakiella magnetica]SCA56932.1 putative Chemotaxis protein CheY [Candidatus Terasakiella magnetica]
MSKAKVLIVDDAPTIRTLMSTLMDALGCDVVGQAQNGVEAEEMYLKHRPDLTLLDIEMPEKNGFETLRSLKKMDPTANIVMLTGHDDTAVAESCMSNGARDFLQKGLSPHLFKQRLNKTLEAC